MSENTLSKAQEKLINLFTENMKVEMISNNSKGDMVSDWNATSYDLIAETAYHLAKLNKAIFEVERGGIETSRKQVDEFSADVANYMAKTTQIFGTNQIDVSD
jgi:hypothetical protein